MKKSMLGVYRTFRHKILYVDGYYKKVVIIILLLLIADLVVLYFIW